MYEFGVLSLSIQIVIKSVKQFCIYKVCSFKCHPKLFGQINDAQAQKFVSNGVIKSHLTILSIGDTGISKYRQLKSTNMEYCPVAQHPY